MPVPNVAISVSEGGLILGPTNFSLRNYTVEPNGSVRPYNVGTLTSGLFNVGGEGPTTFEGLALASRFNRYAFYAHTDYKLADWLTAQLDLSYARTHGGQPASLPRLPSITVRNDNAYLPTAVKTALAAQGLTTFTLGRVFKDIGNPDNHIRNETPHVTAGLKGELPGDWSWDANYGYGENHYNQTIYNVAINGTQIARDGTINFDNRRLEWAADAVVNPATGQIVCRATLPGASFIAQAAGCVPYNIFGAGNISPAALNWVTRTAVNKTKYTQQHATFNLRGRPFSTWAGPVSIGTGLEFRREEQTNMADPFAAQSAYGFGNGSSYRGKFSTKEAYLDTIIPLLRDSAVAKSVDLTIAGRVSDYSTSGVGTVWTWKGGLNWEVIDGLRLRVTKSKDIRAPAIYQLYTKGEFVRNPLTVNGVTFAQFPQNLTAGNPNLEAEIGKTLTIGGVVEPRFLPGFRASVDYFDIKVTNAIGALNTVTIAGLCDAGQQAFCDLFIKDSTGTPVALYAGPGNLASQEVEGLEFAFNYDRNLSDLIDGGPDATLSLSASGSYIFHSWVDTGALGTTPIDRANENSQQSGGALPRLRVDFAQSLTFDKLSVTARERFVSKGNIDNTFNTGPTNTANINTIPKVIYVDLYGSYNFNDKFSLFAAVDNVFDKKPPIAPYPNFILPSVAGTYYDKILRAYRVGFTYDF